MLMQDSNREITRLLNDASSGRMEASSKLFLAVEQQLRAIAGSRLRYEPPEAEMQETVLVNDVFMKLIEADNSIQWTSRKQFFGMAAHKMRQMLVDRARKRKAAKRGGPQACRADVNLDGFSASQASEDEVLALHEALDRLAESEPRKAAFVEMRYFGGFTLGEIAGLHNVSASLVKQDLAAARLLLRRLLA